MIFIRKKYNRRGKNSKRRSFYILKKKSSSAEDRRAYLSAAFPFHVRYCNYFASLLFYKCSKVISLFGSVLFKRNILLYAMGGSENLLYALPFLKRTTFQW